MPVEVREWIAPAPSSPDFARGRRPQLPDGRETAALRPRPPPVGRTCGYPHPALGQDLTPSSTARRAQAAVQYLLEALNRGDATGRQGLYAFQAGGATSWALWRQKGVTAIAYPTADNHSSLWETLGAWAERARNPDRWRSRLLKRAQRGPATMKPHERGQVVHLAATKTAPELSQKRAALPAEWLCVLDSAIRYGAPDFFAPDVDPFIRYGIDSDPVPPKERGGNRFQPRKVPEEVVDVFAPLPLDGDIGYTTGLRGERPDEFVEMPPRLVSLAGWFARVCGEPSAMWWAAGQSGLHAVMLQNVRFALDDRNIKLTPLARTVWRYLFEVWRSPKRNYSVDAYALNQRILKEGWTPSNRRAFADHLRPALKAERPLGPFLRRINASCNSANYCRLASATRTTRSRSKFPIPRSGQFCRYCGGTSKTLGRSKGSSILIDMILTFRRSSPTPTCPASRLNEAGGSICRSCALLVCSKSVWIRILPQRCGNSGPGHRTTIQSLRGCAFGLLGFLIFLIQYRLAGCLQRLLIAFSGVYGIKGIYCLSSRAVGTSFRRKIANKLRRAYEGISRPRHYSQELYSKLRAHSIVSA